MLYLRLTASIGALIFILTGCTSSVSDEYVTWAQRSYSEAPVAALGARDRFTIGIYPEETLGRSYTIGPEGTISHPLIGRVQAAGRTCFELEEEISRRLREGYLRDPSVSCQIEEMNSMQVVVIGAVGTPGPVPYADQLTIVDLVSRVGGLTESAAKDRVQVTRNIDGTLHEITVPVQQILRGRAPNMLIWPGDIVYVPSAGLIQ